jgi:hypothetical protein
MPESFLETDFRLISELLCGTRDVCLGMPDVTRSRLCVFRQYVLTGNFVDELEHGVHGDSFPAGNIEGLPGHTRYSAGEQIRVDHIADVGEIARL